MLKPNTVWDNGKGTERRKRYRYETNSDTPDLSSKRLPIFAFKQNIQYLVEKFPTLIIVGETGSGKTTQIPKYLLEAGWTRNNHLIVVCQPRRIAAISVAARVADELGEELGAGSVGYAVRFDRRVGEHCKILFTTDGTLLRETMQDPLLSRYSVIVLDEAHERSVQTDLLLGLLRKIQLKRPKLRVIISSATLDAQRFKSFFNSNRSPDPSRDKASILTVQGRQHPVEMSYLPAPTSNYLDAAVSTVLEIHNQDPPGDILVFLPGEEEVQTAVSRLRESNAVSSRDRSVLVPVSLYSRMSQRDQLAALRPVGAGRRKVVLSTNVAEASVTVAGVGYVVDSMMVKLPWFDASNGLDTLFVHPVSQAQAKQRAGRAGRTRRGHCVRLCTESDFLSLPRSTIPEVQRCDLVWTVLQLKGLGIHNVLRFRFVSPPPTDALVRALDLLHGLGVVDARGQLTSDVGEAAVEFPVRPQVSVMLLRSLEIGCSEEALTLAGMLSVENVLSQSSAKATKARTQATLRLFGSQQGDHLFLLNLYNAWKAADQPKEWSRLHGVVHGKMCAAAQVRAHLKGYLVRYLEKRSKAGGVKQPILSCCEDHEAVLQAVTAGFFMNAARLSANGKYQTVRDSRTVELHPSTVFANAGIPPQWIVYQDVQFTTAEYVRTVSSINPLWLTEFGSNYYTSSAPASEDRGSDDETVSKKRKGPVWESHASGNSERKATKRFELFGGGRWNDLGLG